ncbi:MAG TPA: hypothetical protein VF740_05400 [Candidatus Acidoferrum sp.]
MTSVRVLSGKSCRSSGSYAEQWRISQGQRRRLGSGFWHRLGEVVTESLAARVDVDAFHTTFYNSSVKVHEEYDLRATWALIYYFGGGSGGKFRSFADRQIE